MDKNRDQVKALEKSLEKISTENELLRQKISRIESKDKVLAQAGFYLAKNAGEIFIGKKLKSAVLGVLTELDQKKSPSKESLSELIACAFWRITRVGIFAIIFAVIPSLVLIMQTFLLKQQNDTINNQYKLIEEQGELMKNQTEASEVEVISNILQFLDPDDSFRSQLAISQLSEYGVKGTSVLLNVVSQISFDEFDELEGLEKLEEIKKLEKLEKLAWESLFQQDRLHTSRDIVEVLTSYIMYANRLYQSSKSLDRTLAGDYYIEINSLTNFSTYCYGIKQRLMKDEKLKTELYETARSVSLINYFLRSAKNWSENINMKNEYDYLDLIKQFDELFLLINRKEKIASESLVVDSLSDSIYLDNRWGFK